MSLDDALSRATRALRAEPGDVAARVAHLAALVRAGEVDAAWSSLRDGLAAAPRSWRLRALEEDVLALAEHRYTLVPAPGAAISAALGPQRLRGGEEVVLGRDVMNRIRLVHPAVAPRAAAITWTPASGAVLQDHGSSNGVFVDGRRVERAVLVDGARIDVSGIPDLGLIFTLGWPEPWLPAPAAWSSALAARAGEDEPRWTILRRGREVAHVDLDGRIEDLGLASLAPVQDGIDALPRELSVAGRRWALDRLLVLALPSWSAGELEGRRSGRDPRPPDRPPGLRLAEHGWAPAALDVVELIGLTERGLVVWDGWGPSFTASGARRGAGRFSFTLRSEPGADPALATWSPGAARASPWTPPPSAGELARLVAAAERGPADP